MDHIMCFKNLLAARKAEMLRKTACVQGERIDILPDYLTQYFF